MTTWKGRVGQELDPQVWEFVRADDAELLPYDCEATAEHARRLADAGLLSTDELDEIEGRLADIEGRLAAIALDPSTYLDSDEDVHSAIERLLGDVGRKIHAGRSRNDQVAAALRLYVLDACAEARDAIDSLALVTLSFAESEAVTVMPGYTHLQRAPHEQVATRVREGIFRRPRTAAERPAPGPGGISDALADARRRFVADF